ncbi:hypothetical protein RND71_016563 [Anisodus tanguticus]|uniref:HIT-type domain-containing protein n=1 Tax=Anisodus tanguticus TaxID=243964 RepID=A0AAE1S809_9SOLA|nr:hypothetical protein RND71_016563 [Anisodus tanguticus]
MTTRSNFYKNPSYAYNKAFNLNSAIQNLQAYNVVTGNIPPPVETNSVEEKTGHRKRHRERKCKVHQNNDVEGNDLPMSHHDYIEKRRKEASSTQSYEELTAEVLEPSSSAFNLVEYDSDASTSSECEKGHNPYLDTDILPVKGSGNDTDRVKTRSEQRFPLPGEPACVICGKYGEYICDETEDDICSTDCKSELLQNRKLQQESGYAVSTQSVNHLGNTHTQNKEEETFELVPLVAKFKLRLLLYKIVNWKFLNLEATSGIMTMSNLSGLGLGAPSVICRCSFSAMKRPGHLPEDCLVTASETLPLSSGLAGESSDQVEVAQSKPSIPKELLQLYKRCHQIGKSSLDASCNTCRRTTTLAMCLDCSNTFCDRVRDIKDLLACHYCFDKAFDKFYDMYSATWKAAGLSIIYNSICCEDHFECKVPCFRNHELLCYLSSSSLIDVWLGYGIVGKGTKLPWYMEKPKDDDADEKSDDNNDYSRPVKKSNGKKTVEELRQERLERERKEKGRERALLIEKNRRDGGFSRRR